MAGAERQVSILITPPHEAAAYLEAAVFVPGLDIQVLDPQTEEERDPLLKEHVTGWADAHEAQGELDPDDPETRAEFEQVALDSLRRQFERGDRSVFVRVTTDPPPRGYAQGQMLLELVGVIQAREAAKGSAE